MAIRLYGKDNPNYGNRWSKDKKKVLSKKIKEQYKNGRNAWNKNKKCEQFTGKNNPNWKGGKRIDSDGYILIWKPKHHFKDKTSCVREHRLIVEEKIGRYLKSNEVIHHINRIKTDNRIENLQLMTKSEHMRIHSKGKSNPNYKNGNSVKTEEVMLWQ